MATSTVVVDFGVDEDGGERRVAALVGVERGDADEPVDARFLAQVAEGVIALDPDGGALEPGFFPGRRIQDLGLVALPLRVAQVHPEEDLGPILGFRPAGARVDGHDGVSRVVVLVEERPELGFVEVLFESGQGRS